MFPFLMGVLGGAAIGGGYVLLRTPRSGSENQQFVRDFVTTTKNNVTDVQDKASNVRAAIQDVQTEVTKLQVGVVPEVQKMTEDFQTEMTVYQRRINDEVEQINNEFTAMTNRINAKNPNVQMDPSSDGENN